MMSPLKQIREKQNLTQEELAEQSGISVRTIQRIESGMEPKGYTRKVLAGTLKVAEADLSTDAVPAPAMNLALVRIVNFSSLPFTIIPPLNILVPIIITAIKKERNELTRQIVSLQIIWTIVAYVLFMLAAFMKSGFSLGSSFMLIVMCFLVLSNLFIILRNAAEIDRRGKLFFRLSFNIL